MSETWKKNHGIPRFKNKNRFNCSRKKFGISFEFIICIFTSRLSESNICRWGAKKSKQEKRKWTNIGIQISWWTLVELRQRKISPSPTKLHPRTRQKSQFKQLFRAKYFHRFATRKYSSNELGNSLRTGGSSRKHRKNFFANTRESETKLVSRI